MPPRRTAVCAVLASAALVLSAACDSSPSESRAKRSQTGSSGPSGAVSLIPGTGAVPSGPAPTSATPTTADPEPNAHPGGVGREACTLVPKSDVTGILGVEVREVDATAAADGAICSWRALDGSYEVVRVEVLSTSGQSEADAACDYLMAALAGVAVESEGLGTRAAWAGAPPVPDAPASAVSGRLAVCIARGAVLVTVTAPVGADVLQGYTRRFTERFLELLAGLPTG